MEIKKAKIHFIIDLPTKLYPKTRHIVFSGYLIDDVAFNFVELYVNNEIKSHQKLNTIFVKKTKNYNRNAFAIILPVLEYSQLGKFDVCLKFVNKHDFLKVDIGTFNYQNVKPYQNIEDVNITVCLPTFDPDLLAFKNQLLSIQQQSLRPELIIIQDDFSALEVYEQIEEICQNYDNVKIFRNRKNLGFYKNIEKLLYRVPDSSKYVALADQDDYWEKDKLEIQVKDLERGYKISYTDLSIWASNGKKIQDTFWINRSNHLKDLNGLLLNNVMTGSTILFDRSMLDDLLPFSMRVGKTYHDHWIAAVARVKANNYITYVDKSLVRYLQHDANVTGFTQFKKISIGLRVLSLLSLIIMSFKIIFFKNINKENLTLIQNSQQIYYTNFQRFKLFYFDLNLLKLKSGVNRIDFLLLLKILILSLKSRFKKYHFNHLHVSIYTAIIVNFSVKLRYLLKN